MPKEKFEILPTSSPPCQELALLYATSFWAGAWKELLIDEVGTQYGTYDQDGNIFPETARILKQNDLRPEQSWPLLVWQLAGKRQIFVDGAPLKQFWTLEKANEVLTSFTSSIIDGGYGGEIMILRNPDQSILGFTAYTIAEPQSGRTLAQKRFPYQELLINDSPQRITLDNLLGQLFPNDQIGIYLDFAIVESCRGQGLGSQLFDARIERMATLGAEVIVGRTIKTSPAQYFGNYIARGMSPIAYDPLQPDKAIFATRVSDLKPRKK